MGKRTSVEDGGLGIASGTGNVVKSKKGFWATTDKEGQRRTCWDIYHYHVKIFVQQL